MKLPYTLSIDTVDHHDGAKAVSVTVTDRYNTIRYAPGRKAMLAFTNFMQWFLAHNPAMSFKDPRNITRYLAYFPPGIRSWAPLMPGGFATHYVHNPEQKKMHNGKRLDFITRSLFRHSYDAVGLRSRAYILSWQAREWIASYGAPVRWLSVAGGSGQPVYDVLRTLTADVKHHATLTLVDIDRDMMQFAKKLYHAQDLSLKNFETVCADVLDGDDFAHLIVSVRPNIIDAMGLFEYLDASQATQLIHRVYQCLPYGGIFIFTNMAHSHPHLDVHKRALGWPGVIQRSKDDVLALAAEASVPREHVAIYTAQDQVYNVYVLHKV